MIIDEEVEDELEEELDVVAGELLVPVPEATALLAGLLEEAGFTLEATVPVLEAGFADETGCEPLAVPTADSEDGLPELAGRVTTVEVLAGLEVAEEADVVVAFDEAALADVDVFGVEFASNDEKNEERSEK